MIRSILFNLIFWPIFGLYIIFMWPIVYFKYQKFVFCKIFRICTWYLLICLKYICKIKYEIYNNQYLKYIKDNTPVIIGCNHQSAWETFIFSLFFDELSIVIKKELLNIPVASLYFRKLNCIPIDRSNPISAIKNLLKYSDIAISKRQNILIFPNGTRSTDNNTEYKSGIYAIYKKFNIPVVPVRVNSGKCWPRRSFRKYPGKIELCFKQPISPGLSKIEFFEKFNIRMQS